MTAPKSRPGPILVINPNSDRLVTDRLSAALDPFRSADGPQIDCVTIAESPIGIMTQRDVDLAGIRVANLTAVRPDASAIVIACYSQPGLDLTRSETGRPVIGMQDAGILAAMAVADRFGVIAVAEASIARHLRHVTRMGVLARLAGEVAPARSLSVAECGDPSASFDLLCEAGAKLRRLGAGAVILGCAGMSPQRAAVEDALGVPVIDAVQAAAGLALARVLAARV